MKKIFLSLFALLAFAVGASAQILVTPYVDENMEGVTQNTRNLMTNKVSSILSTNGFEVGGHSGRFVLGVHWDILDKEVIPGPPTKVSYKLQVSFCLGDGETGTKFAATSFEVAGVGSTEEQAVRNAVRKIGNKAPQITEMVATAKNRIIEYYDTNGPAIIASAKSLIAQREYNAAIGTLYLIPMGCKHYDTAQQMMTTAYMDYINTTSASALAEAQAAWSADPSEANAQRVMDLLSGVDPASSSAAGAASLRKSVYSRVKSLADAEIAHQRKMDQQQINLEKQRINAVRDVAVAYAKNQPRVIYKVHHWW